MRILVKASGQTLAGADGFGLDPDAVLALANEIVLASERAEIAVVVGGECAHVGLVDLLPALHCGLTAEDSQFLQVPAIARHGMPGIAAHGFKIDQELADIISERRLLVAIHGITAAV